MNLPFYTAPYKEMKPGQSKTYHKEKNTFSLYAAFFFSLNFGIHCEKNKTKSKCFFVLAYKTTRRFHFIKCPFLEVSNNIQCSKIICLVVCCSGGIFDTHQYYFFKMLSCPNKFLRVDTFF